MGMNGSAKRLMALFAVTAMIASAMVIVLSDPQESSADDVDCTKYYYDQLTTDFARNAYNKLKNATSFGSFTVDLEGLSSDNDTIRTQLSEAVTAAGYDNPLVNYYFRSYTYTYGGDPVTVTPTVFDTATFSDAKTTYDAAMTTAINDMDSNVDKTSEFTKIRSIHNYVCNTLSYDKVNMNSTDPTISGRIRSVYTSLCGDHMVVCEGYAKMFKVLCDKYSIPCIIVSGMAGTDSTKEAHMWNNVYIGGYWYLVDCTWDDQSSVMDTYLLAGANKEGFNGSKVGNSHVAGELEGGVNFDYPLLSALSIDTGTGLPEAGTQYEITFKFDGATYSKQLVAEGGCAVLPKEPSKIGWSFMKWTLEGDDAEYDFSKPVTSNLTLVAVGTDKPVYTLTYDTQGGSSIQSTVVEQDNNTAKVTKSVPIKNGYKFVGWSTSPTKEGMMYPADTDITLIENCTLYAVWEDTGSITSKIDSFADKAAVFLSEEAIPGVSNLLLTIGVITTVISLLAILAIARK